MKIGILITHMLDSAVKMWWEFRILISFLFKVNSSSNTTFDFQSRFVTRPALLSKVGQLSWTKDYRFWYETSKNRNSTSCETSLLNSYSRMLAIKDSMVLAEKRANVF